MKISVLLLATVLCFAADPSTRDVRKAHARTLLEQQDYAAALDEATALNRELLDDVVGYQLVAAAQLGLGNYKEAETALQWMLDLRLGKADSEGWLLVARFRETTGDIDGALEAVNAGFGRLEPGRDQERRVLLGYAARLHLVAGKLDFADQALAAVGPVERDPAMVETLARLRLAQGKRDEAVQILRGAPTTPRLLYLLATTTKAAPDYAAFERAAREHMTVPGNSNRELVLYLAGAGARPEEALKIARQDFARRHDAFTSDALAMALFASGKAADANEVMQKTLTSGTRDPEILAHAARIGGKSE